MATMAESTFLAKFSLECQMPWIFFEIIKDDFLTMHTGVLTIPHWKKQSTAVVIT
jgi:hypothetical protein